jgi:hypothetical protein
MLGWTAVPYNERTPRPANPINRRKSHSPDIIFDVAHEQPRTRDLILSRISSPGGLWRLLSSTSPESLETHSVTRKLEDRCCKLPLVCRRYIAD